MGGDGSDISSSGEEDGDAEWRAAIDSVAAVDFRTVAANGRAKERDSPTGVGEGDSSPDDEQKQPKAGSRSFKLYQIKAQKLLDDIVSKSLVMARKDTPTSNDKPQKTEGGIRLFRNAPCGTISDMIDPQSHPQPQKRLRIIPGEEIDEKSKKFRRQLQSAAVDGANVMASAKDALQRALSRFEARDASAKAAAQREEERVAKLKKLRGEKWLPTMAQEMSFTDVEKLQANSRGIEGRTMKQVKNKKS